MRYILAATVPVVFAAACGPYIEGPDLRAFGNEPFWNVTVSSTEGIVYGRLGEENITFPYEAASESRNGTQLTFGPVKSASGEHEIEIRVETGECEDTMADVVHPMRAMVTVDGEVLSGCAEPEFPSERP